MLWNVSKNTLADWEKFVDLSGNLPCAYIVFLGACRVFTRGGVHSCHWIHDLQMLKHPYPEVVLCNGRAIATDRAKPQCTT